MNEAHETVVCLLDDAFLANGVLVDDDKWLARLADQIIEAVRGCDPDTLLEETGFEERDAA